MSCHGWVLVFNKKLSGNFVLTFWNLVGLELCVQGIKGGVWDLANNLFVKLLDNIVNNVSRDLDILVFTFLFFCGVNAQHFPISGDHTENDMISFYVVVVFTFKWDYTRP